MLFYFILAAELALGINLVISILSPAHRVWPTPGWKSWQFWFVWALILFVFVALGALALPDWNSFIVPDWLRYVVGLPLFAGCCWPFPALVGWARITLPDLKAS